ncbi:hypothetical protein KUV64_11850 [Mameliella alba]|uniref:hypothetical protein n=1 Tax=Mameliella alba TaxID=561184 RepID=UPI001C968B72|nr:hypothetical protein [Mameliella alba]MBY6119823.1 hypothetical protein [Mameliella alba]
MTHETTREEDEVWFRDCMEDKDALDHAIVALGALIMDGGRKELGRGIWRLLDAPRERGPEIPQLENYTFEVFTAVGEIAKDYERIWWGQALEVAARQGEAKILAQLTEFARCRVAQ